MTPGAAGQFVIFGALVAGITVLGGCVAPNQSEIQRSASPSARFIVTAQPAGTIDERLFGQLLERASWGEPGPEHALVPGTRRMMPEALDLLRGMRVTLMRYPGGTDADFVDWHNAIDYVPGRAGTTRPVSHGRDRGEITNEFGLNEYFQLRDKLRCETALVVNFRNAFMRVKTLEEAARDAAGLVAYTNAVVGAKLPPGMADWPAIRAKNGSVAPFGVKLFQLGNETWFYSDKPLQNPQSGIATREELVEWYVKCIVTFADRMREIDPTIELIMDGPQPEGDSTIKSAALDSRVRQRVQYLTVHYYSPGPAKQLSRDQIAISPENVSDDELWNAWVSMPGGFTPDGMNNGIEKHSRIISKMGYRAACTEWNWNGFGIDELTAGRAFRPAMAKALGAAGFLHGLMRDRYGVAIATQSMLLGSCWDIAAVRVDPTGRTPPYYLPQGQPTALYSRHHGHTLLKTVPEDVPVFSQPIRSGWGAPAQTVAIVDALATADDGSIFLHVLNRKYAGDVSVEFDLSALPPLKSSGVVHRLLPPAISNGQAEKSCRTVSESFDVVGNIVRLLLPPQSINVYVLQIRRP